MKNNFRIAVYLGLLLLTIAMTAAVFACGGTDLEVKEHLVVIHKGVGSRCPTTYVKGVFESEGKALKWAKETQPERTPAEYWLIVPLDRVVESSAKER